MALKQENRMLAIGTAAGENVVVPTALRAREALGELFSFEVDVISERTDVAPDDLLGENATLRLVVGEKKVRYFNGYVNQVEQIGRREKVNSARLTLVPWLWFLTQTSDCRIFQEMAVPDIIKQVFRDFGFSDFEDRLNATYRKLVYCVQYRETAFDFVSRLMEQEGIYYFFEHENGKHTIVLVDNVAGHDPIEGESSIPFLPDRGGEAGRGRFSAWNSSVRIQPGVVVLRDFDFENPIAPVQVNAASSASHANADMEVFDYPGAYALADDGEHYATVRAEELAARQCVASGHCDAPHVACGRRFWLADPSGVLRPGQMGGYLTVETSITVTEDTYRSDAGEGGPGYEASIRAIPAFVQFRPARVTPRPVIQGIQTAMVVGKSGNDVDADEYGRIKVQFHWDRDGTYDEKSSCWIRVAQRWAGKQWGQLFTPRIGQEVIVEFLEGDPDRPLVTGSVYNAETKPPYDPKKHGTISTIKGNSNEGESGFNELRFEDQAGSEMIWMHAQRRMDIRVRGSYRETNYGNREVRVGWEKDGKSGGDYNLYVHQDVNEIVKGAVYEEYEGPYHMAVVTGPAMESFGDTLSTFVTSTYAINADAFNVETKSGISHKSATITNEATSKGMSLKSAADLNLQAQGKINLKAMGGVHVDGTAGVHVKCGGNFVVLTPAGVSIMGTLVNINTGGSASPAGSAKAAESVKSEELTVPLEAYSADDGKPGKVARGSSGGGRSHKTRTLKPQKAPPPPPPPPPPPGQESETTVTPVPTPVSEQKCGIASLEVECQHGRRPGPNNVLQVVSDTASNNPTYSIKFLGKVGLSGSHNTGGEDRVQWTLKSRDEASSGDLKWQLTRSPGAPGEGGWTGGQSDRKGIACAANDDFWPIDVAPEKHYIHGRGCDSTTQRVEIQSFPSQQYKLGVEVERFTEIIGDINDWFEENAADLYGVEIFPSFTGPKGQFELSWGWQENASDWRAYFLVTGKAGYNPVGGVAINFKVSIPEVVAKVGAQSLGIPPVFLEFIDEAKEYVGDIYVKVSFGAELALNGQADLKFWATGEETGESQIKLELTGKVGVEVGAVTNDDFWVSVEVKGTAETGLSGGGMFQIGSDGIEVSPTADFPGVKLKVTAVGKAFDADVIEGSAEWEPIGPQQLYPPSDQPAEPIKVAGPQ